MIWNSHIRALSPEDANTERWKKVVINKFIPDNKENSEENQIKSTVKKQHLMILDKENSSEAAVLYTEVKTYNNFTASTSPHSSYQREEQGTEGYLPSDRDH